MRRKSEESSSEQRYDAGPAVTPLTLQSIQCVGRSFLLRSKSAARRRFVDRIADRDVSFETAVAQFGAIANKFPIIFQTTR